MWGELAGVLYYLFPVLAVAIGVSVLCHVIFIIALPWLVERKVKATLEAMKANVAAPSDAVVDTEELRGFVSWPAFLFMTALLGSVSGVLLSLLGGLAAPIKDSATGDTSAVSLFGATLSLVTAAVAAAVTLFGGDNDKVGLRKPLGAVSFLLCMLICGLYWSFVTAAGGVDPA